MSTSHAGPLLLFGVVAAAVLSIFSVSGIAQSPRSGSPSPNTILIKQMRFNPPTQTVDTGAVIEWKNDDIFSHTVTADNGTFDSGLIAPGQSWIMTANDAGTFRDHCRPHPNMAAILVVSSAGERVQQGGIQSRGENKPRNSSLKWVPPNSPEQIHPILVNFTAALLPLALLSDLLGRAFRRQSLHKAAWWMVLYAAAITPLTVAAGWWWKHVAGPNLPANLITIHQWLGTSLAGGFVVLAVWRWSIYKRDVRPTVAYLAYAFIIVLALIYQGSLGGTMLFGN
jgi:uncharacterized membrane protein/plastocyanin